MSSAARILVLLLVAMLGSGCSPFRYAEASSRPEKKTETGSEKKGWSLLPWGGRSTGGEATAYIEYQRTQSHGSEPLYTLLARNTHPSSTIDGQMRTTLETSPGDMKMDSQSFTLAPNEQRRMLVYPARYPLTYEVSATFRE